MDAASRRRTLRAIGGALLAPLSGCFADDGVEPATRTRTARRTGTPASGGGSTRNGRSGSPVAEREWTASALDGPVRSLSLPAGSTDRRDRDGPLYAATGAGRVARVAVDDGTVVWTHDHAGDGGRAPSSVFASGDAVYVVSETLTGETLRGHVEAVDPATGTRRWVFSTRAFLESIGVVDGSIYLAGAFIRARPSTLGPNQSARGRGAVHAVDAGTGRAEWRFDVPRLVGADVASHGVYALEASPDGTPDRRPPADLHAIGSDGDRRWTVETGSRRLPRPVAIGEAVLAGADGALGRYDPAAGALEWAVGEWPGGPAGIAVGEADLYAGSHPLVAVSPDGSVQFRRADGGRVVGPVGEDALYLWGGVAVRAIEPETGTGKWVYTPSGAKYTHPRAVVDAGIVVNDGPTPEGEFRLLLEETGTVRGSFSPPGDHRDVAALENRLFVGLDDAVTAYELRP